MKGQVYSNCAGYGLRQKQGQCHATNPTDSVCCVWWNLDKFFKNFAALTCSLREFLKSLTAWLWGAPHKAALVKLKAGQSSLPVLHLLIGLCYGSFVVDSDHKQLFRLIVKPIAFCSPRTQRLRIQLQRFEFSSGFSQPCAVASPFPGWQNLFLKRSVKIKSIWCSTVHRRYSVDGRSIVLRCCHRTIKTIFLTLYLVSFSSFCSVFRCCLSLTAAYVSFCMANATLCLWCYFRRWWMEFTTVITGRPNVSFRCRRGTGKGATTRSTTWWPDAWSVKSLRVKL